MLKEELQKLVAFKQNRKKRTSAGQAEFERVSRKLKEEASAGMLVSSVNILWHRDEYFNEGPILITSLEPLCLELYDRLISEGLTVIPSIVRDYDTNEYENQYVTVFKIGWE